VDSKKLEQRIDALLADKSHQGHPLREALDELWKTHVDYLNRLDRITHLSDSYQSMARDRELDLGERFDKQLRQLTKIARISDRYQEMLRDVNAALKEASNHDSLTGLANRRLLMERLKAEVERSTRFEQSFVVAMLDVDNFKHINDSRGHDVGDRVLVEIAHRMEAGLREYDLCGRWGGEEFLLLLPQTTLDEASLVVSRVHQAIQGLSVLVDGAAVSVTASIGMTLHCAADTIQETLKRADNALLEAKRQGKNRYVSA
jgi:diguanylate cyclase (GGDEF)-like protein